MYFENCDCTVCLDALPDEQKVKGINFEYIASKHPNDCDGENLLTYLKALVAQSLLLQTITLACQHKFHLKCVLPLMQNERTIIKCPNCRNWSTVRSSQDYQIVRKLQKIELYHKVLRNRLSIYKENHQCLFPLSQIRQNQNISAEMAKVLYQAFAQFKTSLFKIAQWLSKRRFGVRLSFSNKELDDYIAQDYFLIKDGLKLTI